jgi:predicted RNA binding protein YcfA (HicA-like mRNA interferase family)
MSRRKKLLAQILSGVQDANVSFDETRALLKALGFDERIRGSHHIFSKNFVDEILNLQPKGSHCKSYQVRQIRDMIVKYRLGGNLND